MGAVHEEKNAMIDKSYVTLEQHVCPICGIVFDTGSILMDRRLQPTFEKHTISGYECCVECKTRLIEYVALIEVDNLKKPTGQLLWLKRDVAGKIFNVPIEDVAYIDAAAVERLKS